MEQLPDIVGKLDPKYLQILFQIAVILGVPALLIFANQLRRYGPDIRRLNKIETIAQLAFFANEQKRMTAAFGEATAASNTMRASAEIALKDLESLKDYVAEMQERMSEYNADNITKARLEQELPELPAGTFFRRPSPISMPPQAPEMLFGNMKSEWAKFLEVFKQRLLDAGIRPQLNRMGKMTYNLSDRRRTNPLAVETADLITALHSQYRRYIALQKLTAEEHSNFVQLVKTAINELQRPQQATGSANGTAHSDNALNTQTTTGAMM